MSNNDPTMAVTRLFDPQEMKSADLSAARMGMMPAALIANAGNAVAEWVLALVPRPGMVALLAGPGDNGADAVAAAGHLRERGLTTHTFGLSRSVGDAFDGPLGSFDPECYDLVIDGLFGAGLSRVVEGDAREAIERLNRSATPVLSIDLPSGVSGLSGEVLGVAVQADDCITFERRKPGHLLATGRTLCGRVHVRQIGMPAQALAEAVAGHAPLYASEPDLWRAHLFRPSAAGHKFDRGHVAVLSGGASQTGAARLSAMAALRGGAGLVTVLSPPSAVLVNAAHLTAIMLKSCGDEEALADQLSDRRLNAFVLGPGFGVGDRARRYTLAILSSDRRLVLDADGLTSFQDEPNLLSLPADAGWEGDTRLVLTPHAGEFARLFPDLASTDLAKPERARRAAARSGAVVVLKGADTVIAAPDGRAAINTSGSLWLATAGSGDVLAGIIAAQLAQGLPTFEAACAAVWIHGRAGELFGPGLIAEDLPGLVPKVLSELLV
ncbi:NAD(P)H-hydrate dehydratase [Aureimonas sp. AU12]|uniref:NAD(P)H-hydrate dehydratase n=1 Tax=Aureimonas sp. AU12 TaxID=1638161 RepID=UPI000B11F061|nr:NAD(P)H-hydrate dehydratase [Aureimonas sp. AU12]